MIAPDGYMNFFEIAEWARELSRDLVWAKRTTRSDGEHRLVQVPGERDAIECWAMANFLGNPFVTICSPLGVVMRAPDYLCKHLDQIEMTPIPLPIEESSLKIPDYGGSFELEKHEYFKNRFAYFDWHTGCVDTSKADIEGIIGSYGNSQFSKDTTQYLLKRQSRIIRAVANFNGWSICAKENAIGETFADLYSAFGCDYSLIKSLDLVSYGPFSTLNESHHGKSRKRDRALQVYEERFPNGHEAVGLTLKEATNDVSDAIGSIVSVDTMRRALGKKS